MIPTDRQTKGPSREIPENLRHNLGTRGLTVVRPAKYPDAGAAVRDLTHGRPPGAGDVRLVTPPSPDAGVWIRTHHRVGRRSGQDAIGSQVSVAQPAAMLQPS